MKAKTSAMISLDQARMLVAHLEREEFEQADTILADVCAPMRRPCLTRWGS